MTELAQLLRLLPNETSVPRPLRTGIHVRHEKDSHVALAFTVDGSSDGSKRAPLFPSVPSRVMCLRLMDNRVSALRRQPPYSTRRAAASCPPLTYVTHSATSGLHSFTHPSTLPLWMCWGCIGFLGHQEDPGYQKVFVVEVTESPEEFRTNDLKELK